MTGCCFSLSWLSWKCASFLPFRFQLCLSLVSWAYSQRRGWRWAWTTSNTHQTLHPEDRQEPRSSARLCHCLSSKKTDLEWAVLCRRGGGEGGQAGGKGYKPTFSLLFISVFFCSALSELYVQGERKCEYLILCQVATVSSFICNPFSWCRAITRYSTCHFSEGKGYFQRMKIDFPLDLCTIKKHKNDTRFSLWFPPCSFVTFSWVVFWLDDLWMKGEGNVYDCCSIHGIIETTYHFVADFYI